MSILFYLHKSKTPGYATLYHRVRVNGSMAELASTNVKIRVEHWDSVKKVVKSQDPDSFWKNDQLNAIRNKLYAIYNDYFRQNRPLSAEKLKQLYIGGDVQLTFFEAYKLFQDEANRRVHADRKEKVKRKSRLSPATLRQYETHRQKLVEFLISKHQPRLSLIDFDELMLERLMSWMADYHKHEDSYTYKVCRTVKLITAWAKWKKFVSEDPLSDLKLVQPQPKKPVFLTQQQFENLRDVPFENEAMQKVADVFVVYCRTGFHYLDLKLMAGRASEEIKIGVDGNQWIFHDRAKTLVTAKVPIFKEVDAVISKYGGWDKLPIISDQQMNKWLKLIAAERKLPSDLSVKMGRKTLTDWLLNELNWSEDTVKVVLGLLGKESLKPYGRSDERKVAFEMQRLKVHREEILPLKSQAV